jgi:beta-glucosidase
MDICNADSSMGLPRRKINANSMKQLESNSINSDNKTNSEGKLIFPSGFLWGSATSAHQVEGGNFNDWTEWEKANANRLAQMAALRQAQGKKWPDYILERYPNPLQPENYISGRACDHYNRYEQDFDIARELGQNAHRFSIEWSRIEPEEGKFNEAEIEHYRKAIKSLCERDLEPFVTLWHWTIPLWFRDKEGWLNKKSPEYFSRYAEKIVSALPEVKFWITLNETNVYSGHGYMKGVWPPQEHSLFDYLRVNHHLSLAHKAAWKFIKSKNPTSQVGVAHNIFYFTKFLSFFRDYIYNHLFLNSIRNYHDFIGINYYHSDRDTKEKSEFLNWSIDPESFNSVLKDASRYKKPVYVFENGIADAQDEKRAKFIKDHLSFMHKAIKEGVDVRGYFYWSLLDNFEWDKGFWPRFGLVEIDYKTLERHIRPSAYEYAKICKNNKLEL